MILILKPSNKKLYKYVKRLNKNAQRINKIRKEQTNDWKATSLEKTNRKHQLNDLLEERNQLINMIQQF